MLATTLCTNSSKISALLDIPKVRTVVPDPAQAGDRLVLLRMSNQGRFCTHMSTFAGFIDWTSQATFLPRPSISSRPNQMELSTTVLTWITTIGLQVGSAVIHGGV